MKTGAVALLCGALLPTVGVTLASASVRAQKDIPIEMPKPQLKFGLLIVNSLKGARVKIKHLASGGSYERVISDKGQAAIFQRLTPGNYIVTVTLEGYESKIEKIDVRPNRPTPLTLIPEQITYAATIQTNIRAGEIYYRHEDEKVNKQVSISDGRTELPKLPPGKYNISIKPSEVIYRFREESIIVGKDKTFFKFELPRIDSRTPFSETWLNLDRWDAPAGWGTTGAKLSIVDEGVSLPHNESFRYYLDAEVTSLVRIISGGVAFVLRAVDKQNYYLVRITTPAGGHGLLGAAIIKDGKEQLLDSRPINTLQPGWSKRDLEVNIRMRANEITVEIRDSGDAKTFIAVFKDEADTFPIGAPGLAARKDEQAMIGTYLVQPISDVKPK